MQEPQAMFSVDKWSAQIDTITDFAGLQTGFGGNITLVFHLLFMFYIFSIVANQLLKPESGFQGEKFIKPFVFWLLIVGWFQLSPYVGIIAESTASYVEESQGELNSQSSLFTGELQATLGVIEDQIQTRKDLETSDNSTPMGDLVTEVEYLDEQLYINIAKWIYELIVTVDGILYLLFYFVSRIWLALVAFGGPIALVIAMFSSNYSPLLSWVKAYISVALWSSVCLLVLSICNQFLLMANESVLEGVSTTVGAMENSNALGDITFGLGPILSVIANLVGIGIVFILLKIFLMAKVPSIIQTWVGGAASASGGFGMAVVAINSAKNIGTAGAKVGASAATGGASALAGSLKGK